VLGADDLRGVQLIGKLVEHALARLGNSEEALERKWLQPG
jgi:hypothetical protein